MKAMNRSGKEGSIWVILVVAFLAAALFNVGGLGDKVSGWFGGSSSGDSGDVTSETTKFCPSDGTTTLTLNVQDELATTATNVDTEYYVFNGAKLLKEGTTGSDGTVSADLSCGKDYKILLVNTTTGSGSGGYYGKVFDYSARLSEDTVNEELVKVGGLRIVRVINPNYVDTGSDANTNMTLAAGQGKPFQIQFESNVSAAGALNPIILCQANTTSISKMEMGSFSDGTSMKVASVPARLSPTAGKRYWAWEYGKMLTNGFGSVTASGTVTASSIAPSTADTIACIMVDQQYWKTSGYKTATSPEAAFLFGAENTETSSDVGGTDASTASILIGAEAN